MPKVITKSVVCIYCKSTKVIKHGKTSTGNPRYRCRNCSKTWVEVKNDIVRPELSEIVIEYLNGKTCRELVGTYMSSPLRINQKIREFLAGCPNWEEYLDLVHPEHDVRLVYLFGKSFSCACRGAKNNSMYLALAVDALSSVVIGYEIGSKDNKATWINLLDRLNCRAVRVGTFMTNGSKHIEESIQLIYPRTPLRIYYHKTYRDKELMCCLSRFPINNKLINDAIKAYDSINNHNLNKYLLQRYKKTLKDYLISNPENFSLKLRDRLENKPRIRIEGFSNAFTARFEKFHMLKDDPYPVINGWIAKGMTTPFESGFTRLSLYNQIPSRVTFKEFACGQIPQIIEDANQNTIDSFVAEVAARSIHIPIFYSKCEMKIDKCSLF